MKKFIRGLLTTWIVILLIVLGVAIGMKGILIDSANEMLKKELKTTMVEMVKEYSDEKITDDVIQDIENEIDNNKNLKKIMNKYFDKILAVLSSKEEYVEIDVAKEIEDLINDSEDILEEYGVTITDEEKEELLDALSSKEINDFINKSIDEIKSNMSSDVQTVIEFYAFVTSPTFKIAIISLIAVTLLLIALLHKNYYSWLSNLGTASIITGVLFGLAIPALIGKAIESLSTESDVILSTVSFSTYGYTLIAIGVVSIVAKIFIGKSLNKKEQKENS